MLISQFVELLPSSYDRYVEPFLGGGALFFALRARRALLSDSCSELIATYEAVRDDSSRVLQHIAPWTPDREFYYALRGNRSRGRYKRAAEFIYLNKTCWNGLYRVNAAGEFNVPYGAPKSDNILDEANLRACGRLLANTEVELAVADYRTNLSTAGRGDLVFLDPPYVTGHNNNGFVDYNETLFSWDDQIAAADLARQAADRGATVLVTNAYHDDIVGLYEGFDVRTLSRSSTIASDSSKRTRTKEAIFWRTPR